MATTMNEPQTGQRAKGELRTNERSVSDLVKELRDETSVLIQQELALAKTEAGEKVSKFARNAAFVATGALVAYAGFFFLLLASSEGLVSALTEWGVNPDIAMWVGPLIIGVIVCVAGYAFLQKGISTLRNESVIPQKTVDSLKEDTEWVKHKLA